MKLEKIKAKGAEHLFRHPKTGIIYFRRYRVGVGDVRRSMRTTRLDEAKIARDKFMGAPVVKRHDQMTALELFDAFIAEKEVLGRRTATIVSLKAARKYFEPYFGFMLPDELTAEWWTKIYIPEVRRKTHPKRKFFNDRKWIMSFVKSLYERGVLKRKQRFENPDPPVARAKIFTDDEVSDLISMAHTDDLRLAIKMAVTMGMRRLEIFHLRTDRVDIDKKTINLTESDTKTKKARSMRISPDCEREIIRRAKANPHWIFPSARDPMIPVHKDGFKRAWESLKRRAGVEGRFHWLRHTFLTKAFKAPGANPALICNYAGLSLEIAEKIYLHFDADDTKAVAGLVRYE